VYRAVAACSAADACPEAASVVAAITSSVCTYESALACATAVRAPARATAFGPVDRLGSTAADRAPASPPSLLTADRATSAPARAATIAADASSISRATARVTSEMPPTSIEYLMAPR
jgi:hypothetical protein